MHVFDTEALLVGPYSLTDIDTIARTLPVNDIDSDIDSNYEPDIIFVNLNGLLQHCRLSLPN